VKYSVLPNVEKELSVICLGTGNYGSGISPSDSFRLLDRFAELGGTFIDTAHVYGAWDPSGYNGGYGNSEKVIGEWLAKTGMHKNIAVGTKGAHPDLETGTSRMNPEDINAHLSESLERLKIDSIDLYWVHKDEPSIPADEILGMLAGHVAAGRIKAIGCSNWSIRRQKEAAEAALALGLPGFVASQVGWSLARANPSVPGIDPADMLYMDPDMFRFHVETDLPAAAYSSQACGFFAQKYDGLDFEAPDFPIRNLSARYGNDLNSTRRKATIEVARQKNCSANQLALAWINHHAFPAFPIAGPNSHEQMEDTMRAAEFELTDEEFKRITICPEGMSASPVTNPEDGPC
jgi:aryl-alcohol dehydrogenase-like predicted oxidoreductase